MTEMDASFLDRLYDIVDSRRGADAGESYTARLLAKGVPKIAQKVGEEAVEVSIEAVLGQNQRLAEESADLLYHLMVLWAAAGIEPSAVYTILAERHADRDEKAAGLSSSTQTTAD